MIHRVKSETSMELYKNKGKRENIRIEMAETIALALKANLI